MAEDQQYDLSAQPVAESSRVIEFDRAEVRPGFVSGTYILIVWGRKRCLNMEVSLVPRIYIRCPEYWGIEVVGTLPYGICLPAMAEYVVAIPLAGITGSIGIEVIGANKTEQFKVPGGCKDTTATA